MTQLTQEQLQKIIPKNPYIDRWFYDLSNLLPDYEINTVQRISLFLAQCSHESSDFVFIQENLNYKAETLYNLFRTHFPTLEIAQQYANKPEKIANKIYANRMGNGDENSGEGYLYRGRGLIQITGKDNYTWFAESIQIKPEDAAAYMETFEGAVQSACWFWENNNLNNYADKEDVTGSTKVINGGVIGLNDRISRYQRIKTILGQ